MNWHREWGFTPFGVLGGALILSIGLTICVFIVDWMNASKAERARNRNPHLYQEHVINEIHAGEEFGSFIITFQL